MHIWNWQLTVALLSVAAAVFVLVRRATRLFGGQRAGRCGCGTCPSADSSPGTGKRKPFVPVDSLETPDEESHG